MPSRRDYLAGIGGGLGSAVGLAGCLGRTDSGVAGPLSFGEEATVGDAVVTPRWVHPQASIFYVSNVDWGAIERLDDEWVVFVNVSAESDSGTPPEKESFRLLAGDDDFAPRENVGNAALHAIQPDTATVSDAYPPASGKRGWLAFTVPAEYEFATELRLQFEHGGSGVSWSLSTDTTERIAGPHPTFELVSFEGPNRIPIDEAAELTITVRNTSSTDGVFRVCLNMTGMYSFNEFSFPVEAGAEATATHQLDVSDYVSEPNSTFSCTLRTAETERRISITAAPTSEDS
ncbi:hypothetical protein C440_07097 [Haloferax mucosum ATCC BAA-1512]|uniref:CARDB domain-containing protein n=1 Tax=Haloferax mucosum ATCC BAA-1512 TaxID=662479 RepID=M0IFG1_9EURY|nr:hypothetical protein [Haloferax mucosum]ELZ94822.1 hypothetical protein C440_07097 [Haloferax mucosum ATCC BAA-1512]